MESPPCNRCRHYLETEQGTFCTVPILGTSIKTKCPILPDSNEFCEHYERKDSQDDN